MAISYFDNVLNMKILTIILVVIALSEAHLIPKHRSKALIPTAPKPQGPGSRIINGNQATRGQFPHQVALNIDDMYFCGGSLISTTWVLTAGHCVDGGTEWGVTLGAQSLSSTSEEGRLVVTSRNGILHEEYDGFYLDNDIGVIGLGEAIILNQYVQTVNLPGRSLAGNTLEGQAVTVSGWGLTSDSSTSISDQLNYVDLTVIPLTDCINYYGQLFEYTLCTQGVDNKATCNGDSGGPLVIIEGDGSYTEVGIVSFGTSEGCELGYPNGFARVTYFLDWISEKTGITINP